MWFHVDAAFGALAALAPALAHHLAGIEHADSVAFDFHKWAQVTYDAGCLLVRDRDLEFATFAQATAYLAAAPRGLAGGQPWPCDLGPEPLTRIPRAEYLDDFVRLWQRALGGVVETTCALAQRLAAHFSASNRLEL